MSSSHPYPAIHLDAKDTATSIRIAKKRAELLQHLRQALIDNRTEDIIRLGKQVVGLEALDDSRRETTEPDRRDPSLNQGASGGRKRGYR